MAERARNRITATAQALFRGPRSLVFVKGCGQRALQCLTPFRLGWLNHWFASYPTSLVHSDFSRKVMITIVAHFRTQVVKFIFGGRNSGQKERKRDQSDIQMPAGPRTDSLCSSNLTICFRRARALE